MHLIPPDKHQLEAAAAIVRSRSRREKDRRQRRLSRLLGLAASAGFICIIAFVTRDDPGPYWYLGFVGVLLMIPFLVWRLDEN